MQKMLMEFTFIPHTADRAFLGALEKRSVAACGELNS
jgi:hypothetical protein